jgi:hypothetical protein
MSTVTTEAPKTETVQHTVPVVGKAETETKPKVRRIIDEEGGTTTAKVLDGILFIVFMGLSLLVSALPPHLGSWGEVSTP